MTGTEELRQAVEPYILRHAAGLADVPPRQLQELAASIRRAGRLAIETGTRESRCLKTPTSSSGSPGSS